MFRSSRLKGFTKHETECVCTHTHVCHYTKTGACIYQKCDCQAFKPKGRQEFKNHRSRCEYGHSHDSGLEIKTCFELHCQKLAREIVDFRAQQVIELLGPSRHVIGTYKVDFVVTHLDGTVEYLECKGIHLMTMQPWPLKWSLLQDMYYGDPKYKFRVVVG